MANGLEPLTMEDSVGTGKGAQNKIYSTKGGFFGLLSHLSITLGPTRSCVVVTFSSSSNNDPLCHSSACLWHCPVHLFLEVGAPAQSLLSPKSPVMQSLMGEGNQRGQTAPCGPAAPGAEKQHKHPQAPTTPSRAAHSSLG